MLWAQKRKSESLLQKKYNIKFYVTNKFKFIDIKNLASAIGSTGFLKEMDFGCLIKGTTTWVLRAWIQALSSTEYAASVLSSFGDKSSSSSWPSTSMVKESAEVSASSLIVGWKNNKIFG